MSTDHDCPRCHDTGYTPGTYRLCPCTGLAPLSYVDVNEVT